MKVCVISDEAKLGTRIRQAVADAQDQVLGEVLRVDQAESYLLRAMPDVVIVATARDPESVVATVAKLRDLTSGSVLAVGPITDPRLVLGILRGGAVDYVDESVVESELTLALARIRLGKSSRVHPGRLFAVLGPSGGGGASLVATNLAVAMAKTQERCLIVDLKLQFGDLAALFDLKPSHTLQDLCRVATRIDRVLLEQTLSKLPSGVSLLASPRSFGVGFSSEALTNVFDLGRAIFPRIIADFDPSLPEESMEALRSADAILMVLRLEFNSLRNAKAMLDHLERRGIDPKKILLIGNRVGQPKEIPASKVEEALGRKFMSKLPDDPKTAIGSQNNGVPALTEFPSSRLSKALTALAATLNSLPASTANGA